MNISIVGAGKMAQAIGSCLSSTSHRLTFYDRTPEKAKQSAGELGNNAAGKDIDDAWEGDIIILALPYAAMAEVLGRHKTELNNKVVVDISNPVDFQTFQLLPPPGLSAAEELAKQAPEAKILKAFNTVFAGVLEKGKMEDKPLDIFIAGDDQEAKNQLKQVITDAGMRPIHAGLLSRARHLEGFMLIHMAAQEQLGSNWMSAIKILQ